jgi:hypothetical protein
MSQLAYAVGESTLFEMVRRWKRYRRERILPLLHGGVVEIDAGRGAIADLDPQRKFDAILYLDVVEQVWDDRGGALLAQGGGIVLPAPAHACVYNAFDRALRHLRRYITHTLRAIAPTRLDSGGGIATWDRFPVPGSRWFGAPPLHQAGKPLLAVWAAEGVSCRFA